MEKITVEVLIEADIEKVWQCWTEPEHIKNWNSASDDWHTPRAVNDVQVGGMFNIRMEAKDGSEGFDFEGVYTSVEHHKYIEYSMTDGRKVAVTFEMNDGTCKVTETFDPESENSIEMQKDGWQSILNNFKKYVESL